MGCNVRSPTVPQCCHTFADKELIQELYFPISPLPRFFSEEKKIVQFFFAALRKFSLVVFGFLLFRQRSSDERERERMRKRERERERGREREMVCVCRERKWVFVCVYVCVCVKEIEKKRIPNHDFSSQAKKLKRMKSGILKRNFQWDFLKFLGLVVCRNSVFLDLDMFLPNLSLFSLFHTWQHS